ncbi:hypothetical protein RF11_15041 [Thelohanellus kitauei]|uniref:Uncharacterized protein n=1 Tax=Thelohanellus kitauei TaxID=669202 RepID=A0A0C2MQ88_THEKT|nr:hypothetical protein RF11_15041 [Thelohanellus kitauei]
MSNCLISSQVLPAEQIPRLDATCAPIDKPKHLRNFTLESAPSGLSWCPLIFSGLKRNPPGEEGPMSSTKGLRVRPNSGKKGDDEEDALGRSLLFYRNPSGLGTDSTGYSSEVLKFSNS